jgi:hypothetical protein
MNEKMNFQAFLSALKTYWLQAVTLVVLLGSIFGYGVTWEKGRSTRSQEKIELQSLKDSSLYYYRVTRTEVSNIKNITQGTFDTVQHVNKRLQYYNSKVDLLTFSYKQSLAMNPQITKEQYLNLTRGIDNLIEELKKNEIR